MRLLKKLFSRTAIVLLALLVQIILIAVILARLSSLYIYFALPLTAIGILFVFVVINRNMSASFKVPWIIVLLGMPIVGIALYFVLGYPRLNKRKSKKLIGIHESTRPFVCQDDEAVSELDSVDPSAAGQARYLYGTGGMPLCKNTYIEYLESGEKAFEKLKESLRRAEKFILMEYFIIGEGKMWDEILGILEFKAKMGVVVKVMYDDFGSSGTLKYNCPKALAQKGIDCVKFGKLTPVLSAVHNNRDHRKITVVDGVEGFTGGFNISDEYINETHPYGYWKDTGVYMKGEGVKNLTVMFLRQFAGQSDKPIDYGYYLREVTSVHSDGYCIPFGDGPAPLYTDYIGEDVYLNIIAQSQRYLYITTPYLIVDYHFYKALKTAAKRGVDVRIVVPHVPDKKLVNIMTKSSYYDLIKNGVKIYEFTPGFIHAKTFVCDDKIGVVGTINLDYRSLVHHFECGVWMYRTRAVGEMKEDFDNMLYDCECIELSNAKLKWYQRIVAMVCMIFAPLM